MKCLRKCPFGGEVGVIIKSALRIICVVKMNHEIVKIFSKK